MDFKNTGYRYREKQVIYFGNTGYRFQENTGKGTFSKIWAMYQKILKTWVVSQKYFLIYIGSKILTHSLILYHDKSLQFLQTVEEELESVGENMKVLEKSSEKALEREEKLKDKILQIQHKFKAAEAR